MPAPRRDDRETLALAVNDYANERGTADVHYALDDVVDGFCRCVRRTKRFSDAQRDDIRAALRIVLETNQS